MTYLIYLGISILGAAIGLQIAAVFRTDLPDTDSTGPR